ncbi:hypothetical protein [Shivajiella indica]|uniref:hypothetical protein n=1 Tax=Shivajiella indica TaxID=872115 RepID=UPI0036D2449C
MAAMAASMAEPPFFKISKATSVARGWAVAAMPFCAMTSDLVVNVFPVTLSWAQVAVARKDKAKRE